MSGVLPRALTIESDATAEYVRTQAGPVASVMRVEVLTGEQEHFIIIILWLGFQQKPRSNNRAERLHFRRTVRSSNEYAHSQQ